MDNRNSTNSDKSFDVCRKPVSIIIPTITRQYLDQCVESIEKNTTYGSYEIIIVNDGSSEPEFMSYLSNTRHHVLNLPCNVGYAKANNEGFRVARGAYIMTINADTIVHKDWLSIMVNTLEQDNSIAAVGPTSIYAGTSIIESGGCFWDDDSQRRFFPFLHGRQLQDYPQINTAYRVDAVGNCILFRRDALFEVGLFDENYLNGGEDMDICVSLRNKGYKIYHAPAIIEHYGSFVRKKLPQLSEWKKKNYVYFENKLEKHAIDHCTTASQYAQRRQYDDAIRLYLMALDEAPDLVSAYYHLALIYLETKQHDAAIKYFEYVISYEPRNAFAYNNIGVLYFSKGLLVDAKEYFKKAISLDADYKEALQNLEKVNGYLGISKVK